MAVSSHSLRGAGPTSCRSRCSNAAPGTVGHALRPMLEVLTGEDPPVRIELWDGSAIGSPRGAGHHPGALGRRPAEDPVVPGRARAGPRPRRGRPRRRRRHRRHAHRAEGAQPARRRASACGAGRPRSAPPSASRRLGLPPAPPPEEARQRGLRHSKARDARAISHHYDVGNDFYEIVLGDALTYSCAYFDRPDRTLAEAQAAKHELVCRKLGLHERVNPRLLDVGCGWGSMAMHAATHHGATVVGITISAEQAEPGPGARRAGRPGRPGRDPAPGLPRPRRGDVRRHLVDRHVRARRRAPHRGVLRAARRAAPPHRPAPQPRHLERRRLAPASAAPSPAATCSPTASCSTSARSCSPWSRRASRSATWSRCGSTTPARSASG